MQSQTLRWELWVIWVKMWLFELLCFLFIHSNKLSSPTTDLLLTAVCGSVSSQMV